MCGITGFIDLSYKYDTEALEELATSMADKIQHRGPDAQGIWVDPEVGIALGFRRLAILDLTPTGDQPMVSADGRYVIVFNGEVYNFAELRSKLEALGHSFRGRSDTEVMLAAFCQWGVEAAVKQFNGMFSFALWDRKERNLYLVRDRLGIKPLYYGRMGSTFLFGSELKSLRAHPAFKADIDRNVLALFLRHNYIPAPHSIYRDIYKLKPGTILVVNTNTSQPDDTTTAYWSAKDIAEVGTREPFQGTEEEAAEELDHLLRESIRLRMIADVPLGAFLSGGVDSSTVVALMQAQSDRPVRTFTIGFHEADYNEAQFANAIAMHLGTEHTELYVTPEEAQAVIPKLPTLYDEPFSDSSQVPTFLISELTRRFVTVSLSGDGGDELFGGYNRYFRGRRFQLSARWLPGPIRKVLFKLVDSVPAKSWQSIATILDKTIPSTSAIPQLGDKVQKLAGIINLDTPEQFYYHLISHWKDPTSVVLGANEPLTTVTDCSQWAQVPDFTRWMMFLDLVTYLPDDILVKVDRASMGVSLEARVPLLDDHRVVEFAWSLPLSMKIRRGKSKWLLRQVLYQYVPRSLIERPKMGFGVPIDVWLRGPLREWAESLLDERRLRQEGFFNPSPIRHKWAEHLEGKRNWHYHLWDVLMFQAWLAKQ